MLYIANKYPHITPSLLCEDDGLGIRARLEPSVVEAVLGPARDLVQPLTKLLTPAAVAVVGMSSAFAMRATVATEAALPGVVTTVR